MKKVIFALALGGLIIGCGGKDKKEEKKEGFEMSRSKTEKKAETTAAQRRRTGRFG